jgi:hypothetical protein
LIPVSLALSGTRSFLEGVSGTILETVGVASNRLWIFARYVLLPLTYSTSGLTSEIVAFQGAIIDTFNLASGRVITLLGLGSIAESVGVLAGKTATILKLSGATLSFAFTALSSGLPNFLAFFGSVAIAFLSSALGSSITLPLQSFHINPTGPSWPFIPNPIIPIMPVEPIAPSLSAFSIQSNPTAFTLLFVLLVCVPSLVVLIADEDRKKRRRRLKSMWKLEISVSRHSFMGPS